MIGIFSNMLSFSISYHIRFQAVKFAQAINMLVICRELFYIVWHEEILNHNTFPQCPNCVFQTQIIVVESFVSQLQQIYEVRLSSWRYQSSSNFIATK